MNSKTENNKNVNGATSLRTARREAGSNPPPAPSGGGYGVRAKMSPFGGGLRGRKKDAASLQNY